MLAVVEPILVLALAPIILVEALLYRWVAQIPMGRALTGSLLANLWSTLAGVPATWVALAILQMVTGGGGAHGVGWQAVTWQAPWLIPYEQELRWMIPLAAITLNVPFLLVSLFIEFRFMRRMNPDVDRRLLLRACWRGNLTTYAGLTSYWFYCFLTAAPPPA